MLRLLILFLLFSTATAARPALTEKSSPIATSSEKKPPKQVSYPEPPLFTPSGNSPGEGGLILLVCFMAGCYTCIEGWRNYCNYEKTIASFFTNKDLIKEYDLEIIINGTSHFLTIQPSCKIVKTIIAFIEEKAAIYEESCVDVTCKVKVITVHNRAFCLKPFCEYWSKDNENEQCKFATKLSSLFVLKTNTHLNEAYATARISSALALIPFGTLIAASYLGIKVSPW